MRVISFRYAGVKVLDKGLGSQLPFLDLQGELLINSHRNHDRLPASLEETPGRV